jgi:CheY-like chemotaxis protein
LSAASDDDRPGGDARLRDLLHAMRAVYGGEWSARAQTRPGERDEIAELTRLFNAIAERAEGFEQELVRLRGPVTMESAPAALAEDEAEPGTAEVGRVESVQGVGTESENRPAIVVVEAANPAGGAVAARGPWGGGPMGDAARTALRGLGGVWDQAAVLSVDSPDEVRAAAAGHHVVSALLDARCPAAVLNPVLAALDAEVPGVPLLCFAPDDDSVAFDLAGSLTRGRTRAEVVRSTAQAVERLTLHWLTDAPVAADPLAEPADPNYTQIRFEGEKVLVVDDDVRNVFAMVSALELYGLTALTADNGPEAVELLLRNPDVGIVLMDLMMPGLDGYATTARMRAYPEFADLPIIAVTARAAPGDRERSLAAGTDEHVTKPVEVDQLLALIKRLIKR